MKRGDRAVSSLSFCGRGFNEKCVGMGQFMEEAETKYMSDMGIGVMGRVLFFKGCKAEL